MVNFSLFHFLPAIKNDGPLPGAGRRLAIYKTNIKTVFSTHGS